MQRLFLLTELSVFLYDELFGSSDMFVEYSVGRPYVVDFWGFWPPRRTALPSSQKYYEIRCDKPAYKRYMPYRV